MEYAVLIAYDEEYLIPCVPSASQRCDLRRTPLKHSARQTFTGRACERTTAPGIACIAFYNEAKQHQRYREMSIATVEKLKATAVGNEQGLFLPGVFLGYVISRLYVILDLSGEKFHHISVRHVHIVSSTILLAT